jgi:hypothetical protein
MFTKFESPSTCENMHFNPPWSKILYSHFLKQFYLIYLQGLKMCAPVSNNLMWIYKSKSNHVNTECVQKWKVECALNNVLNSQNVFNSCTILIQ